MDESTVKDSEALLLTYVRYIDKGEFAEEILFCKSLETTTTATDIYNKLENYLDVKNIPLEDITSCATDGAPVYNGQEKWLFKIGERWESRNASCTLCYSSRELSVENYFSCT